jgi:large subunit ribosomal protein L19
MNKLQKIQAEQVRPDITGFNVGDTVKVNTRVTEGGKERIQVFAGIVIGIKGTGVGKSFTVRKVSYGEGVERVFPWNTPRIASVEVTKRGRVRRAKLNYLRGRLGKQATQVKELVTT